MPRNEADQLSPVLHVRRIVFLRYIGGRQKNTGAFIVAIAAGYEISGFGQTVNSP